MCATDGIKTGRYRYVAFTTKINGESWYVTMDSKGERPRKVSHASVRKDLVHTKDMQRRHASSAGYMRRAALKIGGILHVVWGQQSGSLARTRLLTYAGEGKLKAIWDDDLCDDHQWLTAG